MVSKNDDDCQLPIKSSGAIKNVAVVNGDKSDHHHQQQEQQGTRNKRKRGGGDKTKKGNNKHGNSRDNYSEYDSISFEQQPSTGRPGSPHRFFQSSYKAKIQLPSESSLMSSAVVNDNHQEKKGDEKMNSASESTKSSEESNKSQESIEKKQEIITNSTTVSHDDPESKIVQQLDEERHYYIMNQIVHKHANGLCIITIGETTIQDTLTKLNQTRPKGTSEITITNNIQFHKVPSVNSQSVGGKRKKAKMMKSKKQLKGRKKDGGCNHDVTHPMDILATVTLSNGENLSFRSCVTGTIIEINERLIRKKKQEETKNDDDKNSTCHSKDEQKLEDVKLNDDDDDDETANEMPLQAHKNAYNPSLLITDPLLDGYLAVIMPNGKFPPPITSNNK